MELNFVVHRVSGTTVTTMATVKGQQVPATVDALEVELYEVNHGTSFQIRFASPVEIKEAKKTFVEGKKLTWTV